METEVRGIPAAPPTVSPRKTLDPDTAPTTRRGGAGPPREGGATEGCEPSGAGRLRFLLPLLLPLVLLAATAPGGAAADRTFEECLKDAALAADNQATVGELRERCRGDGGAAPPATACPPAAVPSPVDRRSEAERRTSDLPFTLTIHRPNYILLGVYNSHPNESPFAETGLPGGDEGDIQRWEAKFQISLKYRVADGLFHPRLGLYAAYSNLSYWQVYNQALSRPFRDTNHEPEAWIQLDADRDLGGGVRARIVQLGIWHHSNGRSEPLSRSWNRVYANLVLERGGLVVGVKPWWRIPEAAKDDDNPDIEKFYGYGELEASYRAGRHDLSLMFRNNLRRDNMGAIQLGWNFPLWRKLAGYVQYFGGYGQTILDYNHSVNAIGAGISLSGPS